jgi:hypothetical protein
MDCPVFPFIAHRIWQRESFPVHVMHCRECHFMFYDIRPEGHEMAALYNDYRGETYCLQREQFEPGYTRANECLKSNPILEGRRRDHLDELLSKINWHASEDTLVLDHGGDDGRFFGVAFGVARKFVYEISGVKPIPGVHAISSDADLRRRKYDFVMNSNVLEHVSDPVAFVEDLRNLGQRDALFYFEIPSEYPRHAALRFALRKQAGFLRKRTLVHKAMNRALLPIGMHEHINAFSMTAACTLLDKGGFRVQYAEEHLLDAGGCKVKMLCLFARVNDAKSEGL